MGAANQPLAENIDLIEQAKALIDQSSWLTPVANIDVKAGAQFGRNIDQALHELECQNTLNLIQIRKRDKAVVMSVEHYRQLFEMSQILESMVEKERMNALSQVGNEFDTIYKNLTAKNATNAGAHLLKVKEEKLADTFQPGETENR